MFVDTFLRSVMFPSKWLVIIFSTVVTDSPENSYKFSSCFGFLSGSNFEFGSHSKFAYKQTSEVQQEEINYLKMNYQIKKTSKSKIHLSKSQGSTGT